MVLSRGCSLVVLKSLSSMILQPFEVGKRESVPQISHPSGEKYGRSVELVVSVPARYPPVDASKISRPMDRRFPLLPQVTIRLRSGDTDMWLNDNPSRGGGGGSNSVIWRPSLVLALVFPTARFHVTILPPPTTMAVPSVTPRDSTSTPVSITNCGSPDWRSRIVTILSP